MTAGLQGGAADVAPVSRLSVAGRLYGKVAVITGAGQGIGRAFATRFAQEGASVVLADLNKSNATDVAAAIHGIGGDALAIKADVSDHESTVEMIAATVEHYGRLDILVNNASIFSTIRMGHFEHITAEEWRGIIDVNLTGSFFCCQAAVPAMRANGDGAIVNVSSGTVLMGREGYAHYVTSKAGIIGLTRALANELGADGIRVNAVMPGSVETEVPRETVTPEQVKQIVNAQALKRRLRPTDIVGAAVFLASDDASMLTGQSIVIDGGVVFQ